MPVEFIKAILKNQRKLLRRSLNKIRNKGELIEGWDIARTYLIYKAGDEDDTAHYRGVSLLDIGYKLLT